MSLSLTLVFERVTPSHDGIYGFNRLSFGYASESLHDALKPLAVPWPEGVQWLDEEAGLTLRKTDPYGSSDFPHYAPRWRIHWTLRQREN